MLRDYLYQHKKAMLISILFISLIFAIILMFHFSVFTERDDSEYTGVDYSDYSDYAELPALIPTPTPTPRVDRKRNHDVGFRASLIWGQFLRAHNNTGTPIEGGDLLLSLCVTFDIGLFNTYLTDDPEMQQLAEKLNPTLLPWLDSGRVLPGEYGHEAPVWVEVNTANRTLTYRMVEGVQIYWQDGTELTLNDLKFAYELISHPDYSGSKWGKNNGSIFVIGAEAFNRGEADYIEGLVLSEDKRTLTVYFEYLPTSMMFYMISHPLPRHHLMHIPMAEQENHINNKENMIGFGPFLLETVDNYDLRLVMAANENYWRGRPVLDRIIWSGVPHEYSADAMRRGEFDIMDFNLMDWPYTYDLNNVSFLRQPSNMQGPLLHFVLGGMHLDSETNLLYIESRTDNHPIMDRVVRRAIAYVIDNIAISVNFYYGFGLPATSILNPYNASEWIDIYFFDRRFDFGIPDHMIGLAYFDVAYANQMLDDAGYEWGPDGFRFDLNGNPFYINFGWWLTDRNDIVFRMHQHLMALIGIDLRLWNDEWTEMDVLVDYLQTICGIDPNPQSKNTNLHMVHMLWTLDTNSNPSTFWGNDQVLNFSRIKEPELQAAIDVINSEAAWNPDVLNSSMREFARVWDYYVPAVTGLWLIDLTIVNLRVINFSTMRGANIRGESVFWHEIAIRSESPYVHHVQG